MLSIAPHAVWKVKTVPMLHIMYNVHTVRTMVGKTHILVANDVRLNVDVSSIPTFLRCWFDRSEKEE